MAQRAQLACGYLAQFGVCLRDSPSLGHRVFELHLVLGLLPFQIQAGDEVVAKNSHPHSLHRRMVLVQASPGVVLFQTHLLVLEEEARYCWTRDSERGQAQWRQV